MTWGDMAGEDGAENSRGGAAPVSRTAPQAASHCEADGASSGRAVATTVASARHQAQWGPSAGPLSLNSIEAPDAAQYRGLPFREPRWW